MKRVLPIFILFCTFSISFSQDLDHPNQASDENSFEIKFNPTFLIDELIDVSVETLIGDASGFGIFLYKGIGRSSRVIAINPYYRLYTGKQKANGFFYEFGLSRGSYNFSDDTGSEAHFGLNFSLGGKYLIGKNYLIEALVGQIIYFEEPNRIRAGVYFGRRF